MTDGVRPESVGPGSALMEHPRAEPLAAAHAATAAQSTAANSLEGEAGAVLEYANRLVRRLSTHLEQKAPDLEGGSALDALRYLNHQLTEVLSDVRETCHHLQRLSDGSLDGPPEIHGPGTASLREFRHRLRELRVRMAALASGDLMAAEEGPGLLGPELSQLGQAVSRTASAARSEEPGRAFEEGSVRVEARGTLDALSLAPTLDALDQAAADGAVVMLDLSHIHYADASGIGLIRRYAKKLGECGGSLLLVGVQEAVRETMQQLGMNGEVKCFPTAEAARHALQRAAQDHQPSRSSLVGVTARAFAAALLR